jgi:hypothetical protein
VRGTDTVDDSFSLFQGRLSHHDLATGIATYSVVCWWVHEVTLCLLMNTIYKSTLVEDLVEYSRVNKR